MEERDTNPELASRAYSARTASLPNPTLFVNASSPTYHLQLRLPELALTVLQKLE